MRKRLLFSVCTFFWMMTLAVMARGQTIPITGPDTVCVGTYGNYSITPMPWMHYLWTVTPQGNISGPNNTGSVLILWGATGTGTLKIVAYDTLNHAVDSATKLVYVAPLPTVYITSNVTVGCQTLPDSNIQSPSGRGGNQTIVDDSSGCVKVCEGSVVTYTGHGPAGSTYGWTIAGGTIVAAGADTCVVRWGLAGPGSVTVFDTSSAGCVGSKSVCVDIIEKPHAYFHVIPRDTNLCVSVCRDGSIVFVDSSTSAGSPIISWFWNFGDGTAFTVGTFPSSITHIFHTPGPDTVTLVVRNACGCTDTFRMCIVVNPSNGVTIICPHVVCEKDTASYSLSPVPACSSYNWTAEGGTITSSSPSSITVKWDHVDSSGFGYVTFDATLCSIACPEITVVKVPVILQHGYVFGPHIVCTNSFYLYSMPQWPTTTFGWSVIGGGGTDSLFRNDQNNQVVLKTGNISGTIVLKCNYYNTLLGCGGVAFDTITILPQDSIVGPNKICLNTAGSFHVGGGASYLGDWTLTDPGGLVIATGTSITTYTTPVLSVPGTYVLTVVTAGGTPFCPPAPFPFKVEPLPPSPDSLLGPDTACFGTPVRYTARNPVAGYIFEWAAVTGICNFTSGDYTDATFTGGPTATIMVWRVSKDAPHCHSDTISKTIYKPAVNLNITGMDTVCPSTRYLYDAGYQFGETYSWKIILPGKGSVEVDGKDTARILWNNTGGAATIVLTVRKCDSVYTDTFKVWIRSPYVPVITLTPNPVCRDQPFSASISPATGAVSWDWGDLSGGSGYTASHAYHTLSGSNTTYNVVATIVNPFGCVGTFTGTAPITVLPAPVAFVTPPGPLYFCGAFSNTLYGDLTSGYEPTDTLYWATVGGIIYPYCLPPSFPCATKTVTAIGDYYVVAVGHNGCRDTSNVVHVDTSCGGSHGTPCTLIPAGWDHIDSATIHCGTVHLHGIYAGAPLTAVSWSWGTPAGTMGLSTTHTTLDCYFTKAGLYTFSYTIGFADTLGDTCYVSFDTSIVVPIIAGMLHSVACPSGYVVTMLDHSDYFPGHAPIGYSWYLNGIYQTHTTAPSYPLALAPGAYALGEWVYYGPGLADSCWASDSVYLDTLPVANYSFARDTTCEIQASVQFTNLSIPGSGLSYLWTFGDGTSNAEKNPFKVYSTPVIPPGITQLFPVTLVATNRYGCTSSHAHSVPIIGKDLAGTLTGGGTYCSGSPVILTYNPNPGTSWPGRYFWMQDIDTMFMTTTNSIHVFNSGSYWATGTDHYGCFVQTPPVSVDIIQVPPAIITGDHDACLNVPYTLNGWVGNDPTITYKWFKNGSFVGSLDTYIDPAATPGNDTFKLVISVTVSGITCTDTSARFIVTVHNLPAAPYITATMLDCKIYTLSLTAVGPAYGYYNWSNGLSGPTVTVMGGGPYRVWYTDTFGCVNHADKFVPRDPREYLWVFPTGCFRFCSNTLPRTIIGPIQKFDYWAYQHDPVGPVINSGFFSPVGNFIVTAPGAFDLVLYNGLCADTSGILDIEIDSSCNDCACLDYKLGSYSKICTPGNPGCCKQYVTFCVDNHCGDIDATVTMTHGTLSPVVVHIPSGSSCDTFQFSPAGPYTGGWETFTISWVDKDGVSHKCQDSVYINPCKSCAECIQYESHGFSTPCPPPAPIGCCNYYLSICFNNFCAKATGSITITGGTLTPVTFGIPTGSSCDTFHFIPSGSFAGGWKHIVVGWTDGGGKKHFCDDSVYFPPCNPASRYASGQQSAVENASGPASLELVPNPAKNSTRIDYVMGGNAVSGLIQITDMTGRLVGTYQASNAAGSLQLQLGDFAPGVYVVVLKENGKVVQHSKLTVIR